VLKRRAVPSANTARCSSGWGVKPGTVIDVGAADGTPGLYDYFPDANLLLIDPLEEHYRRFGRSNASILEPESQSERPARKPARSQSMSIRSPHRFLLHGRSVRRRRTAARPMITLDEECAARSLHGPYLVKVDTKVLSWRCCGARLWFLHKPK